MEIFFTKKLVTKLVFGVQKSLFVTFHVLRSNFIIRCLGDNHHQLVMRQYFVKFIKP